MMDWADRQAETIVDAFLAYQGENDVLRLRRVIAVALCRAAEMGRAGKTPDTMMRVFPESG